MEEHKEHILTQLKNSRFCRNMIFYDIETKKVGEKDNIDIHKLKLGCGTHIRINEDLSVRCESKITFTKSTELMNFILKHTRKKSQTLVWAHNQHFDFHSSGIRKILVNHGFKAVTRIFDSNLFIVKFRNESKTLTFVDTFNLFQFKLEDLGEQIGYPKLKVDFDTVTDKELEIYCQRDVEIIKEYILHWVRFLRKNDFGSMALTAASQAFTTYRYKFMTERIYIHHIPLITRAERKAFFGGRCEMFYNKPITGKIYKLDFNAFYPAKMRNAQYPVEYKGIDTNVSLKKLREYLKTRGVIAEVDIKTDINCVPYRDERLTFPIGNWTGTYAAPELELFLDLNLISKVHVVYLYRTADIFTNYVDVLYALRLKFKHAKKKVSETCIKILLASLYGKWGQKEVEDIVIGECEPSICYSEDCYSETEKKFITYTYFMGEVSVKSKTDENSINAFPAISAYITSYARVNLHKILQLAGKKNVFYTDTDSVITNEKGFQKLKHLIDENKIGYLKIEKEGDFFQAFGAKDYIFGDERKIKGIKKDAVQIGKTTFIQNQFLKTRGLMKAGIANGAGIRKVTKTLSREYKKGIIGHDGWVMPLYVTE